MKKWPTLDFILLNPSFPHLALVLPLIQAPYSLRSRGGVTQGVVSSIVYPYSARGNSIGDTGNWDAIAAYMEEKGLVQIATAETIDGSLPTAPNFLGYVFREIGGKDKTPALATELVRRATNIFLRGVASNPRMSYEEPELPSREDVIRLLKGDVPAFA